MWGALWATLCCIWSQQKYSSRPYGRRNKRRRKFIHNTISANWMQIHMKLYCQVYSLLIKNIYSLLLFVWRHKKSYRSSESWLCMKWIWSQSRYAATISCLGKKKLNRAQSFLCPIKICVSEPYAQQKHFIVGNWHTLRDRTSHTTPSTFMFNVNYGGKWILLRCEWECFFVCLFVVEFLPHSFVCWKE